MDDWQLNSASPRLLGKAIRWYKTVNYLGGPQAKRRRGLKLSVAAAAMSGRGNGPR